MDNAVNKPTNQVLSAPTSEQDFVAEPSPSSSSLLNAGFGAVLSREIDGVLWVKADDHTYAVDKVHLAWQQRINELEKIMGHNPNSYSKGSQMKLLPCPFCGCKDIEHFGDFYGINSTYQCTGCGATSGEVVSSKAIDAWNRRSNADASNTSEVGQPSTQAK